MLSLIYGTAFQVNGSKVTEVNGFDPSRVRIYRANGGAVYLGHDTSEIVHVCDRVCAMQVIADEYLPTDNNVDALVSIHPYESDHGTSVRTVDIAEFDPGDDPYILCGNCGKELLRDDERFEAMFGHPITNS